MEHMEHYCSTLFTVQYNQRKTVVEFTNTTESSVLEYEYGCAWIWFDFYFDCKRNQCPNPFQLLMFVQRSTIIVSTFHT